ncbi:MAG: type II toxin-antitoxin system VapC family toxin [Chloroflexi bacterium]|nr:type II toxin-antitoxin system VapC family toxin [Chloroflexota bacterium]MBU1749968.1 type II toxin-antitoxin system VapC family toxin [Chloroflexota bacterium]
MSTTFYLDSSALVKRYVIEIGTGWVQALCEQPDVVIAVALIGLVEVAAAVAGKRRGGLMEQATSDAILGDLQADAALQYVLLDVDQHVVDQAIELTRRQRLRGYDAIHLACALRLNQALVANNLPSLVLVAADADLLSAAQAEGLGTENPNLHP